MLVGCVSIACENPHLNLHPMPGHKQNSCKRGYCNDLSFDSIPTPVSMYDWMLRTLILRKTSEASVGGCFQGTKLMSWDHVTKTIMLYFSVLPVHRSFMRTCDSQSSSPRRALTVHSRVYLHSSLTILRSCKDFRTRRHVGSPPDSSLGDNSRLLPSCSIATSAAPDCSSAG